MMQKQEDPTISFWDQALHWFQIYGKQVSIGVTILFLFILLTLFTCARQSDKQVEESINADIISQNLFEEPEKLRNEDRLDLTNKLISLADSSSSIKELYQGLIAQELLLSQDPKRAQKYISGTSKFLDKNGLAIFEQLNHLTTLLSGQEWEKAKKITDTLLALPEFQGGELKEIFMTYSYILLSRLLIFQKTDSKEEQIEVEAQLKTLLGFTKQTSHTFEEDRAKLFQLIQAGSLSILDK